MSLRAWIRRAPRPTTIRIDGSQLVPVPTSGQWAAQLEETLSALGGSKLEALDDTGRVLRAVALADDDVPSSTSSTSSTSANGSELAVVARLLADAHDAGARRHADAYQLAFSENTKLVQLLATRLSGLESAWQKAMAQLAQAQADAAQAAVADQGDAATSAITAMLGAAMTSGASNVSPLVPKVKP